MERRVWETISVDREKLLILLNKGLSNELLAYQYWIRAKVVMDMSGRPSVSEFEEYASDELKHAGMLVARIIHLGGITDLREEDEYTQANCGCDLPEDPLLKSVLKGKHCAVKAYKKLLQFTKDKDTNTYNMVRDILKDEEKHEKNLMNLFGKVQTE